MPVLQFFEFSTGGVSLRLAARPRANAGSGRPGLVWLGGFMSDMESTKAAAIDAYAAREGRAFLRFDYSGHGHSDGRFEDGTISAWAAQSLHLIRTLTSGPQVFIGSSMGAWVTLLCARALAGEGEAHRLAGMVLIAPAVDFTEALMWPRLPADVRAQIEVDGLWHRPSAYSETPYPITRALIEDGRNNCLMGAPIRSHCPVHIIQGMKDEDVPWSHAMQLVEHLALDPVVITLVKEGAHRLSGPADISRLIAAVSGLE